MAMVPQKNEEGRIEDEEVLSLYMKTRRNKFLINF
jgi:hypothetical protein